MLEFQQPPQMPHAISAESSSFSFRTTTKDIAFRPSLPEVRSEQAFPPFLRPVPSTSRNLYTTPTELRVDMDGPQASALGSRGNGRYSLRDLGLPNHDPSMPPTSNLAYMHSSRQPGYAYTSSHRSPNRRHDHNLPAASSKAVAPAHRIPDTIRTPQDTISQLAAEVTCLFWFESGTVLKLIEKSTLQSSPINVAAEAIPTAGFRKWVATLLSTTQVTQNVTLLALLFIYRLKMINPSVKGKLGSEYRLLTVALMLGNKFLDDNTYTNKTWAEVSGIAVHEVHLMEVEFLSNMKYSLFTDAAEWKEWHQKLGKFGGFIDSRVKSWEASRYGLTNGVHVSLGTLPSPPTSQQASPPFLGTTAARSELSRTTTPILLPQIPSSAISPIGPLPELDFQNPPRKRMYDEDGHEPPAKRQMPAFQNQLPYPLVNSGPLPLPVASSQTSRVALPNLVIPIANTGPTPAQLVPQLPLPGSRAMSLVYPASQQLQGTVSRPTSTPSIQTPVGPQNSYVDHSRQLSPYPASSANSSPVSATTYHSHLSPSFFLDQRSSPYRPVRRVQTLLVPPPASSINNAPKLVGLNQMQYHPLAKSLNDTRVGHLPYIHHDAWPQTNQFNQWPTLPSNRQ